MKGRFDFVFFDIGGVLVDVDLAPVRARARAALGGADTGCPLDERFFNSGLWRKFTRGECSGEDVAEALGWDSFAADWALALRNRPRMDALVERVAARVPTGLLSNIDAVHFEWVQRHCPSVRRVGTRVLSFAVGCQKPEREIFAWALAASGAEPGRVLFVDDRQDNARAAEQAGFCSHVFEGEAGLEELLRGSEVLG
jgi:FMN phosphatase YigB (HAD superfamily)